MKRFFTKIQQRFDDLMLILGILMICFGLWQIYPPLAWLFGGAALIFIALVNARYAQKGGDK